MLGDAEMQGCLGLMLGVAATSGGVATVSRTAEHDWQYGWHWS